MWKSLASNLKLAVHCFGNLALEYSTRFTELTCGCHFLLFKNFKTRQPILFRKVVLRVLHPNTPGP